MKGKKASQLWLSQENYDLIKAAATLQRRPMTTFTIMAVLRAAAEVKRQADPAELARAVAEAADLDRDRRRRP